MELYPTNEDLPEIKVGDELIIADLKMKVKKIKDFMIFYDERTPDQY